MAFLFSHTLFWCSIHAILGIPTLDFYLPSRELQNVLRFECLNGAGQADSNAIFKFHNSMGVLFKERLTDGNEEYLTYNITEDFEAFIFCVIGGVHSETIHFTAFPTVPNQNISTDVFRETYAMLMCPIPLPSDVSLHTIHWVQIVDSVSMQLMNDSESRRVMFSPDNRTLSVLIINSTDDRIFQCRVTLRRCSNSHLCSQSFHFVGPFMETRVLERSAITVPPSSQTVTIGDTAIFECNAKGSNITMRWKFNGVTCNPGSCEHNGIFVSMASNNFMIITTLEIRTGEFLPFLTRKNYTIQCIVEQNLDSPSLRRDNLEITIILTVNARQVTESSIGTAGSSAVAVGIAVPLSIVMLLLGLCITIILTIYCIKKEKNQTSDSHSRTDFYMKTTTVTSGGGKSGPSKSLAKHFSDSNLLIPSHHIRLGNTIGQGEFGLVYRSYLTNWQGRTTTEIVAVKTLKSLYSEKNIEDLIAESERMKKFNHPNIMNLIGVCIDVGERPCIVMPFMANGSLLAYLKKERSHLTIAEDAGEEMIKDAQRKLLSMCLQVAKGMSYLAKQKFVHRDLAARNCMIDEQFLIKVGDFGLTEEIYNSNYFRQGEEASVKLPIKWMALESLLDGIFSEKSDIWSFGVTCWEIFSLGHTPYPATDPFSLITFLQNGGRLEKPVNAGCTDPVYILISQCWNESPEKRPDFEGLVHKIDSLLEKVAGYLEFAAFSQTGKVT